MFLNSSSDCSTESEQPKNVFMNSLSILDLKVKDRVCSREMRNVASWRR